jgi:hypothetical protein
MIETLPALRTHLPDRRRKEGAGGEEREVPLVIHAVHINTLVLNHQRHTLVLPIIRGDIQR